MALSNALYRQRVVKSKKGYKRKERNQNIRRDQLCVDA